MDLYCEKCGRTMDEKEFYKSNNTEKFPAGKLNTCKKCLTMHVDNWDPSTYLWILQECDVPYVPEEWNKLLANYGKDPSKLTGLSIMGRYLSKMQLKQWKNYRWGDTEYLQEQARNKIEQTMKNQGYSMQEIDETIKKGVFILPDSVRPPDNPPEQLAQPTGAEFVAEQYVEEDLGLTEEDKTYLRLKWGKAYRQDEWVALESLYNEFCDSYDIQTAGHMDTLKLICKTSLKANQLVDLGDIESYQKMSKVYDTLMKSGKFTAAQNKADGGEYVDCVCELIQLCEEQGFIPRYYVDGPQDKVDKIILDMQKYTYDLVTEELNLGNLIENAIKQLQDEQERINQAAQADGDEDDLLFDFEEKEIKDKDISDFHEMEEQFEEEDFAAVGKDDD